MYDKKTNGFLFDYVVDKLKNEVPEHSIVLMQTCANNPTGIDPTEDQWVALSRVLKDKKLTPMMDSAYLGFVTGDIYKDLYPIRLLIEDGHTFAYAQSYSKNMAMYGERVGLINFVCPSKEKAQEMRRYLGYAFFWFTCDHRFYKPKQDYKHRAVWTAWHISSSSGD